MRGFWRLLTILILASATPVVCRAADPSSYVGRWAVQSGRSNLLILDIQSLGGATLLRPEHFELIANGNAVRGISGSYLDLASTRVAQESNDLDIVFANPANPSDPTEIRISLIDGDHGEITIVGASFPPLSVLRIKADEAPYAKWDAARTYLITDNHPSNTTLTAIFDADQADRRKTPIDWTVVGKADVARRGQVEALLASGQLHTGEDYFHAAFVFQHGDGANDYLLAHTLAMVAVAKRQAGAIWIASATLDRYLQKIGQPQIFGTQFTGAPGSVLTQEPFDKGLISDPLRTELGVGTLAEQEAQRVKMQSAAAPPNPAH
jgi:hypothetical protein